MEDIISFPVYLLIIVGMKRRRPWVRPLVYGVACFSTLRMLSVMISGDMTAAAVNGLAAFLMYLFNGMFIFFFAYQLYFFSRADVRAYYEKPLDK
ncbi:MAG TPA: hypothetical protein VK445_10725 [Dissulfurispiraceae bacterium]|nr:hypothetical protein [Dissulfurispiraceae bacterium]